MLNKRKNIQIWNIFFLRNCLNRMKKSTSKLKKNEVGTINYKHTWILQLKTSFLFEPGSVSGLLVWVTMSLPLIMFWWNSSTLSACGSRHDIPDITIESSSIPKNYLTENVNKKTPPKIWRNVAVIVIVQSFQKHLHFSKR